MADQNITAYVKHNQFDTEQSNTIRNKKPFAADQLHYNKEHDYYVCPMGQHMQNKGTYSKETSTGFIQTIARYQAKNCNNCPLNGACHKSKGDRIIEINHRLNQLKQQANQLLLSEEGIKKTKTTLLGCRTYFCQHKKQPRLQTLYAAWQTKSNCRNRITGPGTQSSQKSHSKH